MTCKYRKKKILFFLNEFYYFQSNFEILIKLHDNNQR